MDSPEKQRLLLIGSGPGLREQVERSLREADVPHELTCVDDLADAEPLLSTGRVDVVLLYCGALGDGAASGENGLDRPRWGAGVPVLLIADADTRCQLQQALRIGAGPWMLDLTSRLSMQLLPVLLRRATELGPESERLRQAVERQEAIEAALRRETARFRMLVETLPHGVVEIDVRGHITYANSAYFRVFETGEQQVIGRAVWEMTGSSDESERIQALLTEVVREQPRPSPYTGRWTKPGGGTIDVRVDWSYNRSETGELRGLVAVLTDMTDQHQAEQDARRRLNDLAHVARLSTVGEMASNLAHELKQPLAAVVNYCRACRYNLDEPREVLEQTLEQIVRQAERASDMIERVRGFVRRSTPQRQTIDLQRLVEDVVGLLEADARLHDIELVLESREPIPPLRADRIQIEQVLVNLVRNAMDAAVDTTERSPRVTIATSVIGDEAVVSVADTGQGLGEEAASRIFEPFFTTKEDGMGLGLSISRSIVEDHGGRLDVDRTSTSGTRFHFTLPRSAEGETGERS